MEGKDIKEALYGVSIAITHEYQVMSLAIELEKPNEIERCIKSILKLIDYEDKFINYLNSDELDFSVDESENTWQVRLINKMDYLRKKNINDEYFKEYSYHIKALRDMHDIIFSSKLGIDKKDITLYQKIKKAYLDSSIISIMQNPDFERQILHAGFDITKINVHLPEIESTFALENCFEIIKFIVGMDKSYDSKDIVENLFNQKLFENYFLALDEENKNEVLNYLESIAENYEDNYYLNSLYDFAKSHGQSR